MWKKIENISDDDIRNEKVFWLSYKNKPFLGYFYDSYGGLNYKSYQEFKFNSIGSVKDLDGYQEVEIPTSFIEEQRDIKIKNIIKKN